MDYNNEMEIAPDFDLVKTTPFAATPELSHLSFLFFVDDFYIFSIFVFHFFPI